MNISLLKDYFLSDNINFNLYAVYIIKNYYEINDAKKNIVALEFLKSQMTKENLLILTSLLNKNDKKLSYTILYILINISYLSNGETLFTSDENICCNIATFLGNNRYDSQLLDCGIFLIYNITINKEVCEIFNKYKITEFYSEIYERNLLDKEFMRKIMTSITNIIHFEMDKPKKLIDKSIFMPCIKIIATQLKPELPPDLIHRYIFRIYELSNLSDLNISYEIFNSKIHKEFMSLYPKLDEKRELLKKNLENIISTKQQIEEKNIEKIQKDIDYYQSCCLLILKIFGKVMFNDGGILTQTLINSGFPELVYDLIHSHDIKVIKNVCFCLSNICAGTYGQIAYFFRNNTLYDLLTVCKNIYEAIELTKVQDEYYGQLKDTLREIIYVFVQTISNSLTEKTVPFVKCNDFFIAKILVKGLELYNGKDEDIIFVIFEGIKKLYILNYEFDGKIIDIMEKYGLKEILEKIMINKKLKTSEDAEELYDALFGIL